MSPWRDGLKKGELAQGRMAAWIDPNCSGDTVLGRYSPFRLCREEGRQSGIMVQDKRETPDRDLSGKKKNSQKLIYSGKSLHTNNEIWEGTG